MSKANEPTSSPTDPAFVPVLRGDFARVEVAGETLVWSMNRPEPTVLDPVAAVMLDVLDGTASLEQLVTDVQAEVGIPLEIARAQVGRVVAHFQSIGLLRTSQAGLSAADAVTQRTAFVGPLTH